MIRDPETLNALLDTVRRFVRERLVPAENEVAETDAIPPTIVDGDAAARPLRPVASRRSTAASA